MTDARYARQMLVAEIGEAGQARLKAATASLSGVGLEHEIATAYAVRAGIGTVQPGRIDEEALAPAFLELRAARAVAAGSRAALAAMREALGVR
jgi:molybdopterin/thiamine biosynthesis adenylyltransferase